MTSDALSQRVKQSWELRRAKYGPSGGNAGHSGGPGGLPHYLPGAHTHGHRNTYAKDGCRCVWCTEANRNYFSLLTRRRKMAVAVGQGPFRHGASGYANHGCRCVNCRVAYYLKDITASAILRQHGIARDGDGDGFLMVARTTSPFVLSRRVALLMRGQILPDDFDDDTRIAEAVLRYHPPLAWTAT